LSTYKCENPECGKVFRSNNPLSCPKCDTLEFSTIHIKSNKKLLVFGFLILLIGAGLFYLNNDESSNTESERTESKIETIKFNRGLMYSTTSLNVRMKPSKNSEKVTSLKLNTPVLTNTKDIGGWVLIADTDSNKLGYVHSNYLSEKVTPKAKVKLKVGQKLYGGIIFYIDESGNHGLVASLNDIGTYEWGCEGTRISNNNNTEIGKGYQNTKNIEKICKQLQCYNSMVASSIVLNSNHNGYTDWHIPSRDELVEMYNNIGNGGPEGDIGGFANRRYWSSSEYNRYYTWFVDFSDGNSRDWTNKDSKINIRVIRAF
jgi:uncharacterized protein YgiM (DUF1202 family)